MAQAAAPGGAELRGSGVTDPQAAPGAGEAPAIEARGIGIRFGGLEACSKFTLQLRSRELVGLIGPNGAGKTTIFNMLTGVYQPTEGEIRVQGRPVAGLKPFAISRLGVARTFQNIRLFRDLTVLDNVRIGAHNRLVYGPLAAMIQGGVWSRAERETREQAMALLAIFGLERRAEESARGLSYGDQRRLEICRALASRPAVLLLDEPAAGMNTAEATGLMETIRRIRDEFRIAILLIEHNMEVVMSICERILVLNYGRTIAEGPPGRIQQDPVVIAAYLGEPAATVETIR